MFTILISFSNFFKKLIFLSLVEKITKIVPILMGTVEFNFFIHKCKLLQNNPHMYAGRVDLLINESFKFDQKILPNFQLIIDGSFLLFYIQGNELERIF